MTAESGVKINADGSFDKKRCSEDEDIEKDFKTSKSLFGILTGGADLDSSDDSSSSLCAKERILKKQGSNTSRTTDHTASIKSTGSKFLQVPKIDLDKEEKKVRKMALRKLNSFSIRRQSTSLSDANKKLSSNTPLQLLRTTGFIARHHQRFLKRQVEVGFSASTDLTSAPNVTNSNLPAELQIVSSSSFNEHKDVDPLSTYVDFSTDNNPTAAGLALPTVVITGSSDSLGLANIKDLSTEGLAVSSSDFNLVRIDSENSKLASSVSDNATNITGPVTDQICRTNRCVKVLLRQQKIVNSDPALISSSETTGLQGLSLDSNSDADGSRSKSDHNYNHSLPEKDSIRRSLESKLKENLEQLSSNFKSIKSSPASGGSSRNDETVFGSERRDNAPLEQSGGKDPEELGERRRCSANESRESPEIASSGHLFTSRRHHLRRQANVTDNSFLPTFDNDVDPLNLVDRSPGSPDYDDVVNKSSSKSRDKTTDRALNAFRRSAEGCEAAAKSCGRRWRSHARSIDSNRTNTEVEAGVTRATYSLRSSEKLNFQDVGSPFEDIHANGTEPSSSGKMQLNGSLGAHFLVDVCGDVESECRKIGCDPHDQAPVIERASNFLLGSHEAHCQASDSKEIVEKNQHEADFSIIGELNAKSVNEIYNFGEHCLTEFSDNRIETLIERDTVQSPPETDNTAIPAENLVIIGVREASSTNTTDHRPLKASLSPKEFLTLPCSKVTNSDKDATLDSTPDFDICHWNPTCSIQTSCSLKALNSSYSKVENIKQQTQIYPPSTPSIVLPRDSPTERIDTKTHSVAFKQSTPSLLIAPYLNLNVIRRKSSSFTARLSQSILKTFHQRGIEPQATSSEKIHNGFKRHKPNKTRRNSEGATQLPNSSPNGGTCDKTPLAWNDKSLKLFKQETKSLITRQQGDHRHRQSSSSGGGKNSPSIQSNVSNKSNRNFGPPPRITPAAFWNFITGRYTSSRRDTSESIEAERRRQRQQKKTENRARKALRTITIILGAFIVCWTPWHVLSLIMGFCSGQQFECVSPVLYDISYWLCYLNSPLNPFCYAFVNQQFKQTFIRIIRFDFRRN